MKTDPYRPGSQLRLSFPASRRCVGASFVVSPSNAEAAAMVGAWPAWPLGALALIGPEGSGKSHLAALWARRAGAVAITAQDADALPRPADAAVLIEDADQGGYDEVLFHLLNRAGGGTSLLLTARLEPAVWPVAIPDLASRLKALTVARIGPPDDVALEAMLRAFFRARHIRPAAEVYPYLLSRIERSGRAARAFVSRLDELADAEGREVSRALARQVIESDESGDLFD
ncbi:MAG: chromosomal replication initiator DnaA [Caulobacteraceae bacterium]